MTKPLLASSVRGVIRNITRNKGVPGNVLRSAIDGQPLRSAINGQYLTSARSS